MSRQPTCACPLRRGLSVSLHAFHQLAHTNLAQSYNQPLSSASASSLIWSQRTAASPAVRTALAVTSVPRIQLHSATLVPAPHSLATCTCVTLSRFSEPCERASERASEQEQRTKTHGLDNASLKSRLGIRERATNLITFVVAALNHTVLVETRLSRRTLSVGATREE